MPKDCKKGFWEPLRAEGKRCIIQTGHLSLTTISTGSQGAYKRGQGVAHRHANGIPDALQFV